MKGITKLTLIVALGFFLSGCWLTDLLFGPSGFKIKTTFITPPSPTQRLMEMPDPGVQVIGNWQGDNGGGSRCGNQMSLGITTDSEGKRTISDGRAPAVWIFSRNGGHTGCGTIFNIVRAISCGQTVSIPCSLTGFAFAMSPDAIDVNAPPATATFTGQGLNTTYGMPIIEYYNEYGSYLHQVTASAISTDGTWLQASVPDLTGLYSGSYTVVIVNVTSDGSRDVVGTAAVWVYGNDLPPPPPDPEPDPCNNPPRGDRPPIECESVIY